MDSQRQYKPSTHEDRSSLIDWGEAIDVPALYGRDAELATLGQWVLAERCRAVALVGLGGIGKTCLALTFARQVLPHFEAVLFRSLRNAPPPADVFDELIRAASARQATPPDAIHDKIAALVEILRTRRCLLILDNLDTIIQAGARPGDYQAEYAAYGALIQRIGESSHQSCLILTSREKSAELEVLAGRTAPVRSLTLDGLAEQACQSILAEKNVFGSTPDCAALTRMYGGNPLALMLVSEPIREMFGGDITAFLHAGDAFFNGVGKLLEQQFTRSTNIEQAVLYWLAIERELVPLKVLLADLAGTALQRDVYLALESLRRRLLIERGVNEPSFTLQPVILEYLTDRLVHEVCQEISAGAPALLRSHALLQATAKDYVRRSQEHLIAQPLLERLATACGGAEEAEQRLLSLLVAWRGRPPTMQGYGPGNIINLLRRLRGDLRSVDLSRLSILGVFLQDVEMQDANLAGAAIQDSVFTEAFDHVYAVATSKSYWAASSRGMIQIWRDSGRTAHLSIPAHTNYVTALVFSPDERILASGSWDCTVKLWDTTNGALLGNLQEHRDYVQSVAFAPDGARLASAGDDQTIRIWDLKSGACLRTLHAHADNVYGVAWSPDGTRLASGGFDLMIRVWDSDSGTCVQTMAGHTGWVTKLAFSPDSRLLASGSFDRSTKIWEIASGRCLQTFEHHTSAVIEVAWQPCGQIIASCSYDATVRLWALNHDEPQQILAGHSARVYSIAFTPDGTLLLSCGADSTMRVWEVSSGRCVRMLQGYGVFFFALAWSPDGRRLLSANSDGTLTLWNMADGKLLQTLRGHTHIVYAAAWNPDGQWLASGGYDHTVRIWDASTGECARIIQAHTDNVDGVAWSPDGRQLASISRDQTLRVWNRANGACHWVGRAHTGSINQAVWSPDGRQLASCGEDHTIRLWRAEDGQLLQTFSGHTNSVAGVAWSPDGRHLASCGGGGTVGELLLWDAASAEQLHSFAGHTSVVFRVAWSPDGSVLLSAGIDGALCWWDAASRSSLWTRQSHDGWIHALSVSPDGTMLASGRDDGMIQLWDMQHAAPIRTLRIDRPYERMDIAGLAGITEAQRAALRALGAVED